MKRLVFSIIIAIASLLLINPQFSKISAYCPSGASRPPRPPRRVPPPPPVPTPNRQPTLTPSQTPSTPPTPAPVQTASPAPSAAPTASPATPTNNNSSNVASAPSGPSAYQRMLQATKAWEVWWAWNGDNYVTYREGYPFSIEKKRENAKDDKDVEIVYTPEYQELTKLLLKEAKSKNDDYAYTAILGLAKTGYMPYATQIEKKEKDKNEDIRNTVIMAYGMMNDKSKAEYLRKTLSNKKKEEVARGFSAYALAFMNDKDSIKIMEDILSAKEEKKGVRATCALALGIMKSEGSIEVLSDILKQEKGIDPYIQAYAAIALGRIGGDKVVELLTKAMESVRDDIRRSAVIAMGTTGNEKFIKVIKETCDKDKEFDPVVVSLSMISMAQIAKANGGSDEAYEYLMNGLKNDDMPEVRGFAAIGLGIWGNDKSLKDLRKILDDKREFEPIRAASAVALGLMKDTKSIKVMKKILSKKQFESLRPKCMLALGLIGDKSGVKIIEKILKDKKISRFPDVFNQGIIALYRLGEKEKALEILNKELDAKKVSNDFLIASLETLSKIGGNDEAKTLIDLFRKYKKKKSLGIIVLGAMGNLINKNYEKPLFKGITADNDYYVSIRITDHVNYLP